MSYYHKDKAWEAIKRLNLDGTYLQIYISQLEKDNAALLETNKQTNGSSTGECTCGKRKSSVLSYPGYE